MEWHSAKQAISSSFLVEHALPNILEQSVLTEIEQTSEGCGGCPPSGGERKRSATSLDTSRLWLGSFKTLAYGCCKVLEKSWSDSMRWGAGRQVWCRALDGPKKIQDHCFQWRCWHRCGRATPAWQCHAITSPLPLRHWIATHHLFQLQDPQNGRFLVCCVLSVTLRSAAPLIWHTDPDLLRSGPLKQEACDAYLLRTTARCAHSITFGDKSSAPFAVPWWCTNKDANPMWHNSVMSCLV